MHHHAPNPAAQPHLSLNASRATFHSQEKRNGGGEKASIHQTQAGRDEQRSGRTCKAEKRECDFGTEGVFRFVSRLVLGHCFGAKPAPSGSASFCFLGSSQNKFVSTRQVRRTNFFRAPPRKHSLALGSRAHFAY